MSGCPAVGRNQAGLLAESEIGGEGVKTDSHAHAIIKDHLSGRELYSQRLIQEGVVTQAQVDGWISELDQFRTTPCNMVHHAEN